MEFSVKEHQPRQVLGNVLQGFWWVKTILETYGWRYCIIVPLYIVLEKKGLKWDLKTNQDKTWEVAS